ISQHVVGRSQSFGEVRNSLYQRQQTSGHLSAPWIWIQTEGTSAQTDWRRRANIRLLHVEPEQIQQQVLLGLSAECKGMGYWKTGVWDRDDPLQREVMLAIELASLELRLLEPILASGRIDGHLAIHETSPGQSIRAASSTSEPWQKSVLNGRQLSSVISREARPSGADATVIRHAGTSLIMVCDWDDRAQYVPGPMYSPQVQLTVTAPETASAWQISTTRIHSFPRLPVAGGLQVSIDNLNQHAWIMVCSDPEQIREIENRIHGIAERAATATTELATLKLRRVLGTCEQIAQYHELPDRVRQWLSTASTKVDEADHELSQREFHFAASRAQEAMRYLRLVQRTCWEDAVARMITPNASPHTISFSTLPDHWAMLQTLRERRPSASGNLIAGGDFQDAKLFQTAGWESSISDTESWHCTSDLVTDPVRSNQLLRLAAWRPVGRSQPANQDPVGSGAEIPLVISTPPVDCAAGDLMEISGRIRRGRAMSSAAERPVLLFDSQLGPENGVTPVLTNDWMTFRIVRPVVTSGVFRFSAAMLDAAEVQLDDLEVVRYPQPAITTSTLPNGHTGPRLLLPRPQ
ncbi:MAG: hypothetical protein KDA96_20755, partial [Planctomycetaceae bacterium]|nr:hypothetical protein [Planctomycetaceae bacterium]